MVNETRTRLGLDPLGAACRVAVVERGESGTHILSLFSVPTAEMSEREELKTVPYVVSVPDDNVMVKELVLANPASSSKEHQVQFELRHSLLDDPSLFCYDVIETCDDSRYLGLLARSEKLDQRWQVAGGTGNSVPAPEGYVMRAVALGRSYLHFCERNENGLVCLMDPTSSGASLCFVYRDSIVALGHFDWQRLKNNSESDQSKIAAELKTLINFRLSELMEKEITSTFSAMIVSGSNREEIDCEVLANQLSVCVTLPPLKKDATLDVGPDSVGSLSDYFVPLGLTVE